MADNKLPCYVFVYGTLKRGYGNYDRILKNTSQFVGTATTCGRYDMLDSGFPVIMENPDGGHVVRGDVFLVHQIPVLDDLDRLEGEGSMYDRKEIEVELIRADNKMLGGRPDIVRVQTYVGCPAWARRRQVNPTWLNEDDEWVWDLKRTHYSLFEEDDEDAVTK